MYDVSEIQSTVKNIASELPISKVILIGSYAKNEATENSDIDLVVDGNDLSDAYWDFLFKLEDVFSVKIDLMTSRGLQRSCMRDRVLAGGILIYET
jgi:predicted nucleotidyltransferase